MCCEATGRTPSVSVIGGDVPAGIVVVRVDEDGGLHADVGPDAARMQLGEGLHLANLVAANCLTSLVYDREMLERSADTDLPWSTDDTVARMGGDRVLSVSAFEEAIRGGRTVVTNGPWLTLEVNGHGPGAVLDLAVGDRLDLRARVQGPGAEHLTLVGPDGVMAEGDAASQLRLETTLEEGPTWIAAVARGAGHPNTLDQAVLAHASPVYVDVAGRRVARVADARWCLEFLDALEQFVGQHGHYDPATRTAHFGDLVAVLEQARSFYRRVAESADREAARPAHSS